MNLVDLQKAAHRVLEEKILNQIILNIKSLINS